MDGVGLTGAFMLAATLAISLSPRCLSKRLYALLGPVVVPHELAHAGAALLLGAKEVRVSLCGGRKTTASVSYALPADAWLRDAAISAAPLGLLAIAVGMAFNHGEGALLPDSLATGAAFTLLAQAGLLSASDWEGVSRLWRR